MNANTKIEASFSTIPIFWIAIVGCLAIFIAFLISYLLKLKADVNEKDKKEKKYESSPDKNEED